VASYLHLRFIGMMLLQWFFNYVHGIEAQLVFFFLRTPFFFFKEHL